MDEQRIDEVLAKIEADPGRFQRSLRLTLSGFVPLLGAWMAFGKPGGFFAAVLGVPLALISHTFYLEAKRPRAAMVWSDFLRYYANEVCVLSGRTHRFCERMTKLYETDNSQPLLPFRHAARLLSTYHKQQNRLQLLHARLNEIDALYQPLATKIEKLRELREINEEGERTLRELGEAKGQLLALKSQMEASAGNLEAILSTIENEWKKRRLHQEVAVLAGRARTSSNSEPFEGIIPDPVHELEGQITREIQTYLQLERETDQRLNGV